MSEPTQSGMRGWSRSAVLTVVVVTGIGTAAIAALLVNIMERRGEAQNSFFRVVELTDETEDPAIWGKNFPLQYDGYLRTVDQQRTRFGGSEAMPRSPTEADPRSIVAESRLEEDPRLKTMWAGYAFATDFRIEARSCVHARGPDLHRARAAVQAAGHLHPLSRVGVRALHEGREWRLDQGIRALQPDAVSRGTQVIPTLWRASIVTRLTPWRYA